MELINKLIRRRIGEIIVVLSLVGISIPIWKGFQERMNDAEVMTLEDYSLVYDN